GQVNALVGEVSRRKALAAVLAGATVKDTAGNLVDMEAFTSPAEGEDDEAEGAEAEGAEAEASDEAAAEAAEENCGRSSARWFPDQTVGTDDGPCPPSVHFRPRRSR